LKVRPTKDGWRWVALAVAAAILFVMGEEDFHLKHTESYFAAITAFCFLLPLPFFLTRKERK